MSFLLDEDEALRNLLKDMTVTDQKSVTEAGATRKVGVWFGQPDQEIRNQNYPYITIDMIDLSEDIQRAMRGRVKPSYLPNPTSQVQGVSYDGEAHSWDINYPIPVNIDYQITTYARQPRHDRDLGATPRGGVPVLRRLYAVRCFGQPQRRCDQARHLRA